jgi:hypothetical protein
MTAQFEDENVVQPVGYDPFPQPQTIPAGWDVSAFSYTLETASAVEESPETESH